MISLRGQKILVVGLGKSGVAACRFLLSRGAKVRATEHTQSESIAAIAQSLVLDGVAVETGGHTELFCRGSRLVVVSPGVPDSAVPIQWAKRWNIPVIGELELGARYCRGRIAAVTGSNGKSTVTTLLGEMLKTAGRPVVVAGNIGTPLTSVVDEIRFDTTVALEVSSFQLEHVDRFHPSVACVLNVTPNHIDRHENFDAYIAAKRRLLTQQGIRDWAVLNADDPVSRSYRSSARGRVLEFSLMRPVRGAYLAGQELVLMLRDRLHHVATLSDLKLQGEHNIANALAAIAMGGLLGLDAQSMRRTLVDFRGLEHRIETVAVWNDIVFVNDSKSTTVEAGLRALEACPSRAVLIAGGKDKGSDFARLQGVAAEKLRAAVLIGTDGPRIAQAIRGIAPSSFARSLPEAIHRAAQLARPGDWVLLSPMCTSFDMFRDFEERGEIFKESARALVALEKRAAVGVV